MSFTLQTNLIDGANKVQSSSEVEEHNTEYASPDDFHTVKTEIRDVDGTNISVQFYLDDTLMATQYGGEYVGKPLHLWVSSFQIHQGLF